MEQRDEAFWASILGRSAQHTSRMIKRVIDHSLYIEKNMSNQPQQLTGYRQLSQTEIDLINEIKAKGVELEELVTKLRSVSTNDQRWISTGATDLQKGLMCLTRGVAQPTTF